jgi:hypothetical protein
MAGPGSDPLRVRPHGLSFEELRALSEYLDRVRADHRASLNFFRDPKSGGYDHRVGSDGPKEDDPSKASTATCLAYLRAVGGLSEDDWPEKKPKLRKRFITGKWDSAELGEDNVFTVSFLLDAIDALGGREGLSDAHAKIIDAKLNKLGGELRRQGGGLALNQLKTLKTPIVDRAPEEPQVGATRKDSGDGEEDQAVRDAKDAVGFARTAFLVHKAVRALKQWDEFPPDLRSCVQEWNWNHLYEESMLIASDSPDADYLELAYSVLTASEVTPLDGMTPRQRTLLQHAIEQFFGGQRPDGTWPRSRPLFLYPGLGFAYCYDYELLFHLLSERQLGRFVIPHLDRLRQAAWALDARRVPLERAGAKDQDRAFGWSSEHHGKDAQAESWPTAAVFHFCFELSRLVADAIRQDVFDYVDVTYKPPKSEAPPGGALDGLMDSVVMTDEGTLGFKQSLIDNFVQPLIEERDNVRDGREFGGKTKIAAIMYGPPGTSKTRISGMIAKALGWELLALDPSHLTRRGMDNVHAEADALFGRLRLCDQLVVLLDEVDELVRERERTGEVTSRFLTTAMLPKLAALHSRRRIVYIVATNHLEVFDAAISRPGRFDLIIPVMPPTADAKAKEWDALKQACEALKDAGKTIKNKTGDTVEPGTLLDDLTYDEAESLAAAAAGVTDIDVLVKRFEKAAQGATLYQPVLGDDTPPNAVAPGGGSPTPAPENWKQRIDNQRTKIRGLAP